MDLELALEGLAGGSDSSKAIELLGKRLVARDSQTPTNRFESAAIDVVLVAGLVTRGEFSSPLCAATNLVFTTASASRLSSSDVRAVELSGLASVPTKARKGTKALPHPKQSGTVPGIAGVEPLLKKRRHLPAASESSLAAR